MAKEAKNDGAQFNAGPYVSYIWSIADDWLRDVYVPSDYRKVILPMVVLRRLDLLLEPTKAAVLEMKARLDEEKVTDQDDALCGVAGQDFCNSSPFTMRELTSRTNPNKLKADFIAYLDGFSKNVQKIIERFEFRNQIPKMLDAGILHGVIDKFVNASVNLSPFPVLNDDGSVRQPALDNHAVGTVYEELLRKFNEESNAQAGDFFTPRDAIWLMVDLVFTPIAERIKSTTYACLDCACGTCGMLTIAEERLLIEAKCRGKRVSIHLFGQENLGEAWAIANADMLIKGEGGASNRVAFGSTLSDDQFAGKTFDFMFANPPYGKSWKKDAELMGGKDDIDDPRFTGTLPNGETVKMIPRTSDGQLLFLLNNVAKMKTDTELGSRIAEVNNGSSLFTGDAGSGESNARRYLIENDLVEAIVAVPENMFYNTGIGTFIWILSNRKEPRRKGKIQLIDATRMFVPLRRNLGDKNCEFSAENRAEIMRLFMDMVDDPKGSSRVFDNSEFGYWQITVERPLRLKVDLSRPIPQEALKPKELEAFTEATAGLKKKWNSWDEFAAKTGLKKALLKKLRAFIAERDPEAEPVEGEADPDLRDTENVPFAYPGGIDGFFAKEVKPYVPDAWVDVEATKIGYEISFTKYFYEPVKLRELKDIASDMKAVEKEARDLLGDELK